MMRLPTDPVGPRGDENMKLGFIGLGRMGAAMAANLVKAGHRVSVFNRSAGKSGPLIELGAREAADLAGACSGEVVVTMLADDDAVSDIALRPGGLIDHLPRGAIHLSTSTISVALSKRLTQAHAQAGQRYVAAPVFGRPDMAAAAKLFIVVAGDFAAVDACQPLFRAMGQKTFPISAEPAAAPLGHKDIRLALAAAESLRVPMPLASLLHNRFQRLLAQGGDKLDWSAIGGLATQDAGRPMRRA
jgi:3-hydroxyisobutyrate dehydrogenase-like beta-hydroxyacid dehydrogenase